MSKRAIMLALCAGVVASCTEGTGPPVPDDVLIVEDGQLHAVRWKPSVHPRVFEARGLGAELMGDESQSRRSASPSLSTYAAFWAVRGETRSVEITYDDDDGVSQRFMLFTVPAEALDRYPDGRQFANGDSVLISLVVDTTQFLVHMEPTGLVFSGSDPAQLEMSYAGSDADFDGDGAVDEDDRVIEQERLRMWYQEEAGDAWEGMSATRYLASRLYVVALNHFSSYAISW